MTIVAPQIIAKLNFQPQPEVGFMYAESSRDKSLILSESDLSTQYKVDHPISTGIYLLLPSRCVSHLHRIPCSETWNIYLGDPLTMNEADGSVKLTCLGSDIIRENQLLQYTVPPNVWFDAFPTKDINISKNNEVMKNLPGDAENHFSLVGCTCASALEFAGFELAKYAELVSRFPSYEALISILTLPPQLNVRFEIFFLNLDT